MEWMKLCLFMRSEVKRRLKKVYGLWFPGYPCGTSWGRCLSTCHQWRISRYPVSKDWMEKSNSYVSKERAEKFHRDPALSLSCLPRYNSSRTAPWHLGLILPFCCTPVLQLVLISFTFSCPTLSKHENSRMEWQHVMFLVRETCTVMCLRCFKGKQLPRPAEAFIARCHFW